MGANTFSISNIFTYFLLAGLGIWSWLVSLPRKCMGFALYCLDTFESVMLSFVWEYQGENILQFLFKHRYVQTGALIITKEASSPAAQAASIKTRGVQTETQLSMAAGTDGVGKQKRPTRDVLVDKMLEELVPALLHALHEMPKRNELAELAHEQTQLVREIYERQQQLIADHNQPDNDGSDIVAPALQLLISRVNAVDTRLLRMLSMLDSSKAVREVENDVDNRLALLVESLGAVKAKFETDRVLAAEMMQSLAKLDKAISSTAVPRLYVDASVETETFGSHTMSESASNASSSVAAEAADRDNLIEQGTDISSHLSAGHSSYRSNSSMISIKSLSSIGPGADSACENEVLLVAVERVVSSSSGDQDPVPFAKEKIPSDTTLKRVHYDEPAIEKVHDHKNGANLNGAKTRSPRRFSLKNGIRRHSWFGKKPIK